MTSIKPSIFTLLTFPPLQDHAISRLDYPQSLNHCKVIYFTYFPHDSVYYLQFHKNLHLHILIKSINTCLHSLLSLLFLSPFLE